MSTAASPPACDGPPGRLAVVVMGVSGSGKSQVGAGIAAALGVAFVDGDDLHMPHNVAKMKRGVALTDQDRWPWLDRIGALLADASQAPAGLVVACSALRRDYRDRIRADVPVLHFVFLDGPAELIRQRMTRRRGHYMPTGLLDSQFRTLERPGSDEPDVLRLPIELPVERIVADAVAALRHAASARRPP